MHNNDQDGKPCHDSDRESNNECSTVASLLELLASDLLDCYFICNTMNMHSSWSQLRNHKIDDVTPPSHKQEDIDGHNWIWNVNWAFFKTRFCRYFPFLFSYKCICWCANVHILTYMHSAFYSADIFLVLSKYIMATPPSLCDSCWEAGWYS